ncbi:MAG TPA: carboxylating nicotinate-nucleotide diphosphorylase [Candidatus Eisenbacteria bacterium]|nr:carboxylating nicotinate-nucleotide diphosphorylase [Candidatus Eisenbacteria bacterium]
MKLDAIVLPLVRLALTEDLGGGDVTTDAVVDADTPAVAHIEARAEGVLAGSLAATLAFRELDPGAALDWKVKDGGDLAKGTRVCEIRATARAILSAERVALNFLQKLSGIATQARAFVRAVEGTGVTILDTRKTTPCLRLLEKLAVRSGGATNHRFGLYDEILVKENHIAAAGSLGEAIARVRRANTELPVVVEARTPEEAQEAAGLGVDRILLDNFTPSRIADLVKRLGRPGGTGKGAAAAGAKPAPVFEVSGGVRLANVREFAIPGVSFISVGALTHSAPALDLSLLVDSVGRGGAARA